MQGHEEYLHNSIVEIDKFYNISLDQLQIWMLQLQNISDATMNQHLKSDIINQNEKC